MKERDCEHKHLATAGDVSEVGSHKQPQGSFRQRRHHWRWVGWILLALVVIGAVVRALLPLGIRQYVNRALDRNLFYSGRIGPVHVHLWRGAYSIQDIRLSKRTGNVPVPFFTAKRVDFALQWVALLHRRVVGAVMLDGPELNFVDAPAEEDSQSGAGGPWLETIRDLFPFTINSAKIQQGSIHFRVYQAANPVDVYLDHIDGAIGNLSNIRSETTPLVAKVQATAQAMEQAPFEFQMVLDPFSYRPTFHLATRLLGLDVTKLNDLAQTYGSFDFKRGWFDLVIEADAKEGQLTGYVKPLFRQLKVFSLKQDVKEDDVLQFFWQALLGLASSIFKNQNRDQFGTLIPFSGDLSGSTSADLLATVGNVLRNAFVRAYLPRLQAGEQPASSLQFGTPQFTEALSTADKAQ